MDATSGKNWIVERKGYDPERSDFYESLFSQGNGYMGIRGFFGDAGNRKKYENCTYITGVYDYLKPGITDFVNTPNYFQDKMLLNGSLFSPDLGRMVDYEQKLDMRDGTLGWSLTWEDEAGRRTHIEYSRFLSLADRHNAAGRYRIKPLNYSGLICFEAGVDSEVENLSINDDQMKKNLDAVIFLKCIESGSTEADAYYVLTQTSETGFIIAEAFKLQAFANSCKLEYSSKPVIKDGYTAQEITFFAVQGTVYTIDKFISVYTSRDLQGAILRNAAIEAAEDAFCNGFDTLLQRNRDAWSRKWEASDIIIEGDDRAQLAIRYNIFSLIQGNPEDDPNASMGARGLTHGRYKGCYFWDTEIFMLPFFIYTNPKAAKNLLMYRYNTLPGAEANAAAMSLEGARYAWMCTLDGREQCETWDTGCCEVHITADIAYAVDQYWEATGDIGFIRDYGAEMLVKTARYWKSRFSYDESKDAYNMLFVKGPDEYCGVTSNNTFTTIMAVNNMKLAIKAIDIIKQEYNRSWNELKERIGLGDSETEAWKDIINKAVINYDPGRKLYIEDDNFERLEPFDLAQNKSGWKPLYCNIAFDRLQRLKVLKQADIIQLMILLPEQFTEEEKKAAWDYYEPMTSHDSTLSFSSHAIFAARLGLMEKACDYFYKSVRLDMDDIMGNTGKEGLHYASLGASWQAVVMGFAGLSKIQGMLALNPHLPDSWRLLKFRLNLKGQTISVEITRDGVSINPVSDINF